jgi:phage protein D
VSPMLAESLKIEIDGEEISDLYDQLASVEVELDEELPAMVRIRVPLLLGSDGAWSFLDDTRFSAWKPIVVSGGLDGELEELLSGYITHVRPHFEPDMTACALDVWGLDASVVMDREDKLKDWPNKKDSDIAAELFDEYGLTPDTDDTEVIHDEAVSTIIQRETDWQFLARLAARNGFECFLDGGAGHFHRPRVDARPQVLLAVHFGDDTNVNRFSLEVNALTPVNVAMTQVDRPGKEIVDAAAESSDQQALGATVASGILGAGIAPASMLAASTVTTGAAELDTICRALFERQEWFVTGEGEIAANQSGVVLKPRGTATIKGVGEPYSGVYYVTRVTHTFSGDGYTQAFAVKRNALAPTGAEDFG